MRYKIVVEKEYIRASYWGNDDASLRRIHSKKLISLSDSSKTYNFLIDTSNLDSIMDPLDFVTLARYFKENNLADKVKIAIVCFESDRRYIYSKFNLNTLGILSEVFYTEESAIKWLIKHYENAR